MAEYERLGGDAVPEKILDRIRSGIMRLLPDGFGFYCDLEPVEALGMWHRAAEAAWDLACAEGVARVKHRAERDSD